MLPAFLARFRPSGPWRFGPVSGARHETESFGHSDTLYSALSWAMKRLGEFDPWLETTASIGPAVYVSSLYPFLGRTLYVVPPRTIWPPAASPRVRWKAASFVPASVVSDLLAGKSLSDERWEVDPRSKCLIPSGGVPPFRIAQRNAAAIDRLHPGAVEPHGTACLEFNHNAGLWAAVVFASEDARAQWESPIKAAFRLLADSGIGGERTRGWGRSDAPEFQDGEFPKLVMPNLESTAEASGYWLLSLYSPGASDRIDWSAGSYDLTLRAGLGTQTLRMAVEGSVLASASLPQGQSVNIGTDSDPVYRAGFACAVPLPTPRAEESAA